MDQPATKSACYNKPFRSICFTSFVNPEGWLELPKGITFLCWGDEVCPKTGREHKQGFAYSARAMRMSAWIKTFPKAHVERMFGTLKDNEVYCSKGGSYHTLGVEPMANGHKRCLEELVGDVIEAADNGIPLDEVVTEPGNQATFVSYHNGIQKLYNMQITKRLRASSIEAPEVIWLYGPPGSGKTRTAHEEYPNLYRIPTANHYKWKDGYSGQDVVLYDNVTPKNIDPDDFLQEIDRYYIQVSVKGGFIGWRPKKIYITSVYSPDLFVLEAAFSHPNELLRRITCQRQFTI